MRTLTTYEHHTGKLKTPLTFLVVSDLHCGPYDDFLPMLSDVDALLVPGDVADRYRKIMDNGLQFLRDAARLCPTFFSVGNHETGQDEYRTFLRRARKTGATVLANRYVKFGELWIGGWYAPKIVGVPDMLDAFEALNGPKVLLCHKPHEYIRRMRDRDIDLVVAGHAHGGQIRAFGRGLYAPGQGFLPKYTRGVVDGRRIISAGAYNPNKLPRWGNPCEILKIIMD